MEPSPAPSEPYPVPLPPPAQTPPNAIRDEKPKRPIVQAQSSASSVARGPPRFKEKFHSLRDTFDKVSKINQESQRTLEYANAKMQQLEAENSLLLDALSIALQGEQDASGHPRHAQYSMPPPPQGPPGYLPSPSHEYPAAHPAIPESYPHAHPQPHASRHRHGSGSSVGPPSAHPGVLLANGNGHYHTPSYGRGSERDTGRGRPVSHGEGAPMDYATENGR